MAQLERERAEAAVRLAEAAKEPADAEKRRADRYATKLHELGVDPDTV